MNANAEGAICKYGYWTPDSHAGYFAEYWGYVVGGEVRPVSDVEGLLQTGGRLSDLAHSAIKLARPILLSSLAIAPDPKKPFLLRPAGWQQEIWAAGVTYESSKFARMAESEGGGDFYAKVYGAERPELFFKATPRRVVGPDAPVRIRTDSTWNVPEPELAAVIAANGKIVGYTVGNDMSSRSIEGENPLYLPQAKVYTGSCAIGPWIVPAESVDPQNLGITMVITRGGREAFRGETSTARMKRTVRELADWLFRENDFPGGVILLTGTGIIPPESFTLYAGDEIDITIENIGVLRNWVTA
jgi:2-dehydro-3-deoxy-D-arabinonate dehydratase